MLFPLFFVWLFVSLNEATFSDKFQTFLRLNFGSEAEKNLSRVDVGPSGSFGGGNHTALLPTNKVPVIFIHGNGGSAAAMAGNREYFIASGGYTDDEVFATTYGNLTDDSIRCEYLKSLRRLIIAVNRFCGFKKVNVFGHSRGVPNTRKAILGGKCVDSGEELGPSLTNIVLNYVSLAGSNHGALDCVGQETSSCNSLNGVQPGSAAINDINSKVHYEGLNTFALLSKADDSVGYEYNGIILTELPSANKTYTFDNLSHGQVSSNTYATQLNIVNVTAASRRPMPLPATTSATTGSTFATFEVPSSPTTPMVVKQHMPPITIGLPHRPVSGPIPGGPNSGVLSRLGQAQLAVAAAAAVASRQQNNGTSGRSDQSEDEVREAQVEIRHPQASPAQVTTIAGTHGTIASTSTLKNAIVNPARLKENQYWARSRALSANSAQAKSLLSSPEWLALECERPLEWPPIISISPPPFRALMCSIGGVSQQFMLLQKYCSKMPHLLLICAILCAAFFSVTLAGVPLNNFYRFGKDHGDKGTDAKVNPDRVDLEPPFRIFRKMRDYVYVRHNVWIELAGGTIMSFYLKFIFNDLYTGTTFYRHSNYVGAVLYRQSNEEVDLDKARREIGSAFPAFQDSNLKWVIIGTWKNNGHANYPNDLNTFQAVLTTDGVVSFVIFNYNETIKIQDTYAGFVLIHEKDVYPLLERYKTDDMLTIDHRSNVNIPGKWVFRIDLPKIYEPSSLCPKPPQPMNGFCKSNEYVPGVLRRLGQAQLAVAAAAAVASRQQNNGTSGRLDLSENEVRELQAEIRQPQVSPIQVTTTAGTHGTVASTSTLKNAIVNPARLKENQYWV